MTFRLEIETDNAAFVDDPHGEVASILRDQVIPRLREREQAMPPTAKARLHRSGGQMNTGEFDDEFPDDHSHEPQDISLEGGHQGSGVFACDDEGRHYYLEIKVTNEGLILDVFDRYGEECLATFGRTFDELVEFVFAKDPMTGAAMRQGDAEHWVRDVNGNKVGSWTLEEWPSSRQEWGER